MQVRMNCKNGMALDLEITTKSSRHFSSSEAIFVLIIYLFDATSDGCCTFRDRLIVSRKDRTAQKRQDLPICRPSTTGRGIFGTFQLSDSLLYILCH
jgi:hypothetical protein